MVPPTGRGRWTAVEADGAAHWKRRRHARGRGALSALPDGRRRCKSRDFAGRYRPPVPRFRSRRRWCGSVESMVPPSGTDGAPQWKEKVRDSGSDGARQWKRWCTVVEFFGALQWKQMRSFPCKLGGFFRRMPGRPCSVCDVKCSCMFNREDRIWAG
jgi:hypothetical protein